jgi:hypothetical protein
MGSRNGPGERGAERENFQKRDLQLWLWDKKQQISTGELKEASDY